MGFWKVKDHREQLWRNINVNVLKQPWSAEGELKFAVDLCAIQQFCRETGVKVFKQRLPDDCRREDDARCLCPKVIRPMQSDRRLTKVRLSCDRC